MSSPLSTEPKAWFDPWELMRQKRADDELEPPVPATDDMIATPVTVREDGNG